MTGGDNILIIGMTGQGKSKMTFKLIRNSNPCLVYDVNNEYGLHPKNPDWSLNLPTDLRQPRCRYAGDNMNMSDFMGLVRNRKNTNVVFEEATGFFSGNVGKDLIQMAINKRHTGNNYIFLFHSLRSVPPKLLDFANIIILFKTGDDLPTVQKKHSRLVKPFLKVQRLPIGVPEIINWQRQLS